MTAVSRTAEHGAPRKVSSISVRSQPGSSHMRTRGAEARIELPSSGVELRKPVGRRKFLGLCSSAPFWVLTRRIRGTMPMRESTQTANQDPRSSDPIKLFLCGDVMTGRGIDQVLPHPGNPRICESDMASALGYVALAEAANGPIPRPVDFSYVWGDSLVELEHVRPDLRIVNLETSITKSEDCTDKGISYRMSPENVACITAAKIDCCVLVNNHILDWGRAGLIETLETLDKAKLKRVGAGRDTQESESPAILEVAGKGRTIVFGFGSETSGIPQDWGATADRPGVNLLESLSPSAVERIARLVARIKRPDDIVIASIHWGSNWGSRKQLLRLGIVRPREGIGMVPGA
ncbi:MAG: CapA family protein [Alphaproteobacteria bacterium]